jgi:nicotinamide-nucleotide amidase
MNAAILTIGDELLEGRSVDGNAAWLGEQLDLMGLSVTRSLTVGDDRAAIREALRWAYEDAGFVVTTGGLGPTDDDLTREAVAAFTGRELIFHEDVFARIQQMFAERGRTLPASNRSQALVPEGATVLPNPKGTAPGLWHAANDKLLAVLPGVPAEMRHLFEHEVRSRLRERRDGQVIRHRTICTAGIGESHLHERVGDVSDLVSAATKLAFLPSPQGVRLRLTARGDDEVVVEERLDRLEERLRERAEKYIFGTGSDTTIEAVAGTMLRDRSLTVAVAESCTGGYVANRITSVSGSSAYFEGGVVAYSYASKTNLLDVSVDDLREVGAVSEAVARQMAEGVRRRFQADLGLATTGIAGPTGGTPDKPVGTVWIGCARRGEGVEAKLLNLTEERALNKALSCTALLNFLRRLLSDEKQPRPA